jgi:hypothetical protein
MPSRGQIHQMAARWLPESRRAEDLRIHTDTSDFFALDAGDIVVLDGRPYLVRFYETTPQLLQDLHEAKADIR